MLASDDFCRFPEVWDREGNTNQGPLRELCGAMAHPGNPASLTWAEKKTNWAATIARMTDIVVASCDWHRACSRLGRVKLAMIATIQMTIINSMSVNPWEGVEGLRLMKACLRF